LVEDDKKYSKKVIYYSQALLDSMNEKKDDFPNSLRIIFSHLTKELHAKFPEEEYIGYIGVSSFLFLRLICAAINSPKLFKLMEDHPEPKIAKLLTQVAKTIIKISTLNPNNSSTDPNPDINSFIESEAQKMRDVIDFFCLPKDENEFNPVPVELDRQVSILVEFLEENLNTSLAEYYIKNEDVTLCENLVTVMDALAKKEKTRYPYLPTLTKLREKYQQDQTMPEIPPPQVMERKKRKKSKTRTRTTTISDSSNLKIDKRTN